MSKVDDYRNALTGLAEWRDYLLANSNLPGPRGNLELAEAVADEASAEWIYENAAIDAEQGPENTPESFVVNCAGQGLGRLAAEVDERAFSRLHECAEDPRWRIRESTAIALQRLGDEDFAHLLAFAEELAQGSYLQQRAAAAALCEPRLLKDAAYADRVVAVLDGITRSISEAPERRSDAFRALRQGMGYCWSVAIAAYPEAGQAAFEDWLSSNDKDVRWLLRENLKKKRLLRLDSDWVAACKSKLS